MNLCIFGEPGFGKTTLVEALTKVTEERLFGNGVDYTFREMNDPDEADLLTQADVAVLVSNTEGGLTDQSDELLSLAEELNVAHLAVFINKSDLIDTISETFDLVTSSLVFDYVEDFPGLMRKIHHLMKKDAVFVFSMSHPIVTAWDGAYDRYTRTETGERLYANLRNYCKEGLRKVDWVVNGYECYHQCQEAHLSDEMRAQYPALFGGTIHRPEFIFFRCRIKN